MTPSSTYLVDPESRPRVGLFKLASCSGCQMSLVSAEEELLLVAGAVKLVNFPLASSYREEGEVDVALVTGSVNTPEQVEELQEIRREARVLVALGACATAGGIQALCNWAEEGGPARTVYARPEYLSSLSRATPLSDHVEVDAELRGCPINAAQLVELVTAHLAGRAPTLRDECLCIDCKRQGRVCVTVARGIPCLGPVTQAGCGALCPAYGRGCYGCFGPRENANTTALADHWLELGIGRDEVVRRFRSFAAYAPAFRLESDRHEP